MKYELRIMVSENTWKSVASNLDKETVVFLYSSYGDIKKKIVDETSKDVTEEILNGKEV